MTIQPDAAIARKGALVLSPGPRGALFNLALNKTIFGVAERLRLTAPPKRAQHTEKTAVFDYSKVKERVRPPGAGQG
jgi:hypothetical protein